MSEEKMNEQASEEEKDYRERSEKAAEQIRKVRDDFIRGVFGSIDYKSLFHNIGQPEKFDEFKAWVDQYEAECKAIDENAKEGDEIKYPDARSWVSFLEDNPVSATQLGIMFDQLVSLCVNVSAGAAQVIDGAVYDTITGPQFMMCQTMNEQIASAIGTLTKRIDELENLVKKD